MIAVLCEKPSAARHAAAALFSSERTMRGRIGGQEVQILAARGHLFEFSPPDRQAGPERAESLRRWDLKDIPWDESLFSWTREVKPGCSALFQELKKVLRSADEIVIATDLDPTGEGELLAWEIIDAAGISPKTKITRMDFIDESASELSRAYHARRTLPAMQDDPDWRMAEYRSRWDFLSMQFTRAATLAAGNTELLRQGRLKSVMTALTASQQLAYESWKKVSSYERAWRDDAGNIYIREDAPRFDKPGQADLSGSPSGIRVLNRESRKTAPPAFLDLSALAAALAPKGIAAKTVLETYQKLYEANIVSYPRTEDKTVTPEQFEELKKIAPRAAAVCGIDASLLTHTAPRASHVKTGGAHGANRPGPNVPESLSALCAYGTGAAEIYELITRRALAPLAEDAAYEAVTCCIDQEPAYRCTVKIPGEPGWRTVSLSPMSAAQEGSSASPFERESFPKRPARPSLKWLMQTLKKESVGTGATRTSTFAEISGKGGMLKDSKGVLSLTRSGEISAALTRGCAIADTAQTKALFDEMRAVADGRLTMEAGLARVKALARSDLAVMLKNAPEVKARFDIQEKAAPKPKTEGVWRGKPVKISPEWGGHRFTDEELAALFAGERITLTALRSKSGRLYSVTGELAEQTYKGKKYVGFKADFK